MRRFIVTLLLFGAVAHAQQNPEQPAESSFDDLNALLLAAAQNNVDIRAAEADVRLAGAEVDRVSMQVARDIAQKYAQRLELEREIERKAALLERNLVSEAEFAELKLKFAELESQLQYLAGSTPSLPTPFQPKEDTRGKPLDNLETLLTSAAGQNVDVRKGQAQLDAAEAQLERVRMQVTRDVVAHHAQRQELARLADSAQKKYKNGAGTYDEATEAALRLVEVDAKLRYLTGQLPRMESAPAHADHQPEFKIKVGVRPTLEQTDPKIREKLSKPVSVSIETGQLSSILNTIADTTGIAFTTDVAVGDPIVRLYNVQDLTFQQLLAVIADVTGDVCFLIRDYGIFATTRFNAGRIAAPSIPPDVPLFVPDD